MQEHWIVENNSGGVLVLTIDGHNIVLKRSTDRVDLVFRTGKKVADLEENQELSLHFDQNNLITIEKQKNVTEEQSLSLKIDSLMSMLSNMPKAESNGNITDQERVSIDSDLKESIAEVIREQISKMHLPGNSLSLTEKEEQRMRELALQKLVNNQKKIDSNFNKIGKDRVIDNEADGNEDLIDI